MAQSSDGRRIAAQLATSSHGMPSVVSIEDLMPLLILVGIEGILGTKNQVSFSI